MCGRWLFATLLIDMVEELEEEIEEIKDTKRVNVEIPSRMMTSNQTKLTKLIVDALHGVIGAISRDKKDNNFQTNRKQKF